MLSMYELLAEPHYIILSRNLLVFWHSYLDVPLSNLLDISEDLSAWRSQGISTELGDYSSVTTFFTLLLEVSFIISTGMCVTDLVRIFVIVETEVNVRTTDYCLTRNSGLLLSLEYNKCKNVPNFLNN